MSAILTNKLLKDKKKPADLLSLDQKESIQKNTAMIAIAVAVLLAIGKFAVAFLTSSLAILATAVDSMMDAVASTLNFFSIRKSHQPADKEHNYGHGKAESLAGFVQAELMIASALYLVYESARKIHTHEIYLQDEFLGMSVMVVSVAISLLLYLRMRFVAQKTQSVAIRADSIHYLTDVLTNFAVFASLVVVYFWDIVFIDPVLSICISFYLIYSAWGVMRESIDILMDKSLPDDIVLMIHDILISLYPKIDSYHNLQTRRAGNSKFVDMHIVMPKVQSLESAHNIAEEIIRRIHQHWPEAEVNIHLDPRDDSQETTNRAGGLHAQLG